MSGGVLLGSGVDAIHPCQSQLAAHLLQKVDALAQAVKQRQIKVRLQDAQHHAGEAGAGAHVDDPIAPQVRHSQQRRAVQQVQCGHILRRSDGRQVHHPVLFQQRCRVGLQLGYGIGGQSQLG